MWTHVAMLEMCASAHDSSIYMPTLPTQRSLDLHGCRLYLRRKVVYYYRYSQCESSGDQRRRGTTHSSAAQQSSYDFANDSARVIPVFSSLRSLREWCASRNAHDRMGVLQMIDIFSCHIKNPNKFATYV